MCAVVECQVISFSITRRSFNSPGHHQSKTKYNPSAYVISMETAEYKQLRSICIYLSQLQTRESLTYPFCTPTQLFPGCSILGFLAQITPG